jgi:hypothetical protein
MVRRIAPLLLVTLLLAALPAPGLGGDAGVPGQPAFKTIDLGAQGWFARQGFSPADAAGFDPGVLALHGLPIQPNRRFAIPPRSGVHEFTLMTRFRLDSAELPPLAFRPDFIGENWALYINGTLLGSAIHLASDGSMRARRSLLRPTFPIPERALRRGENTLVVRLIGEAPPLALALHTHLQMGGPSAVIDTADRLYARLPEAITLGVNGVCLFFGLFYLAFYIQQRLDTTVVGDTVNVAARLEQLTKRFGCGVLISESTWRQLTRPDAHWLRRIGSVVLKGKSRPLNVYEVFDFHDEAARERRRATRPLLEPALDLLDRRRWRSARDLLLQAQALDSDDPVLARHIVQCERRLGLLPGRERPLSPSVAEPARPAYAAGWRSRCGSSSWAAKRSAA